MSLYIDIDTVTSVLLADGQWYDVLDRSFDLDSYEMHHEQHVILGGGNVAGVPSTGFRFVTRGLNPDAIGSRRLIMGPLTAILALEVDR